MFIISTVLEKGFSDANLVLNLSKMPFGSSRGSTPVRVFQMTIRSTRSRHDKKRTESFDIFPGSEETKIAVLDTDKKLRQLVFTVHEPKRKFQVNIRNQKTGRIETIERETPDWNRLFLAGMDQTHLFIAQLPKSVSSVDMAHHVLKPHEIRHDKSIKRQGEWFFIPVTPEEEISINNAIEPIQRNFVISGRPKHAHVADESVKTELGTFVRGKIAHPDHYALVLHKWCKFVHNTEKENKDMIRIGWID